MSSSSIATWRISRQGSDPPPAESLTQRAHPFGAACARAGTITLLAMRTPSGVVGTVSVPDSSAGEAVAVNLAAAVGGRAERLEEPPVLEVAGQVATLVARPHQHASRSTQHGADPAEVASALGRALSPGQWVAVALRAPSRSELTRARRWFDHRLAAGPSTHYSSEMNALVASVYAGGPEHSSAHDLLGAFGAAVPGFDVEATAVAVSSWATAAGFVIAGVAAGGTLWISLHLVPEAVAATTGLVAVAGGVGTRRLPSHERRLRRSLGESTVPPPRHRHLPALSPRTESTTTDGKRLRARPGSWPLAHNAFLVGPGMLVGVVSPHSPEVAEVAATHMRSAPAALLDDIGPLVGYAGDGTQAVHLSAEDLWAGVAALGIPGSGKTALLNCLWTWVSAERRAPRYTSSRSAAQAMICFETKADGLAAWEAGLAATGDTRVLVELADPGSPAIDMTSFGDTPAERAEAFVAAMTYAFPEGSVQGRSSEALGATLTAALAADLDAAWSSAGLSETPNPILATHVLLGGWGDEEAVALATAIANQAIANPTDPHLAAAARSLRPFFAQTTPAQRRNLTEAARNKVRVLAKAGSWWDPRRPRIDWGSVLAEGWAVIVNTGAPSPRLGRPPVLIDESLTDVLTAMLTYLLRAEIERTCAGWQDQGRSVSIFADELSSLAGASPAVIAWLRERGRSYGVRLFFATQRPGQLDAEVRTALLGFGTMFFFSQQSQSVAREAAANLSMSGTPFTESDLSTLERYHAALRATAGGRAQPGVTIRVAHWDDPADMLAEFGYRPSGVSGAPPQRLSLPAGDGPAEQSSTSDASMTASRPADPYATG